MVFNEQLNMSEPNSPFATQPVIPNQSSQMNNGNPNNGSGIVPQIIESPPLIGVPGAPGPISPVQTQGNTNTTKPQRYSSGGDVGGVPQINTKAGTGKAQTARAGRGSKNLAAKNDRR